MSLRRSGALVAAVALTACTTVTMDEQPADLVFATFNSTTGVIPIPSDLVIQKAATAAPSASLPAAQIEVLKGYAKSGGFPSDVEVKIDIPFTALHWNPTANGGAGAYETVAAPTIDPATITASTVTLLKVDGSAVTPVAYEPVTTVAGKLSLRPVAVGAVRRWAGGRYVVAVRGGASGVKTSDGKPVNPDQAIALAIQNKDLSIKENQPPGFPPELASQVNALAGTLWNPLTWKADATTGAWTPSVDTTVTAAFPAVDTAFPHAETAAVATFAIDASAHVALDQAAGQVPFPSDFLLEQNVANCPTGVAPCIINNPAFGPAAQGLRTLDGFSTTALLLAPLTGAVDATTITWGNVHIFDLSNPALPVRLKDLSPTSGGITLPGGAYNGAAYVNQPPGTSSGGFATTMVLAPAVPADLTAAGLGKYALPPLKEKTRYAVIVTKRVKNAAGTPMTRSAAGNIILSTTSPLFGADPTDPDCAIDPNAAACNQIPYVSGIDLASAKGLQALRDGLAPLLAALPALTGNATTKDDVVMAYTILTQSITGTALSLASAPYAIEAGAAQAIFAGTGIAPATPPAGLVAPNVAGFFTLAFNKADLVDKSRGTLRPTLQADLGNPAVFQTLVTGAHALVAVPQAANVPLCPSPPFPAGARCAKLVIVGHGLGGDKDTVFALANELTGRGFIVAGIDFPLHGEQNWCRSDTDCSTDGTTPNGTCDKTGAFAAGRAINDFSASAGQGDCGSLAPASPECTALRPGICANGSTPLKANTRYLLSANFFRVRDTFRQYLFDIAALELAVARPPTGPQPPGNPLSAVLPAGVVVDPSAIYYEGLSWGSINGTSVVATHPRISRGVLSVGGGTVVDAITTSPTYRPGLDAILVNLIPGYTPAKVTPGNPAFDPVMFSTFTQLLQVAKWIIDPSDPINYAQHVRTAPLPNLLAAANGSVPQTAKDVFAQMALGDTSVPNPTNFLLDTLINGSTTVYTDDDPAGGPAPHDMLATNVQVQIDAALYLVDPVANVQPATKAVTFP